MSDNPNTTEVIGLSSDALDSLFDRSNEQAVADRAARQRAAEWPSHVEATLVALAKKLVALQSRLDAVEAVLATGNG